MSTLTTASTLHRLPYRSRSMSQYMQDPFPAWPMLGMGLGTSLSCAHDYRYIQFFPVSVQFADIISLITRSLSIKPQYLASISLCTTVIDKVIMNALIFLQLLTCSVAVVLCRAGSCSECNCPRLQLNNGESLRYLVQSVVNETFQSVHQTLNASIDERITQNQDADVPGIPGIMQCMLAIIIIL